MFSEKLSGPGATVFVGSAVLGGLSCPGAGLFLELQEERHRADYDPTARYTRQEANEIVGRADQAIRDLRRAPRNDRTAFAALALIRRRT